MMMTREVYTKKFPEKIIGEDDTNQKITACMSCGLSLESTSVFKSIQEEKVNSKIQVLEENEIMKRLAKKNNLKLVDGFSLIPKEDSNFVDSTHFTPKGMNLLAKSISEAIKII